MFRDIQTILEKLVHLTGGELRRWQADVVHHQQGNLATGALVEVGRGAMTNALAPTAGGVQLHTGSLNEAGVPQYAAFRYPVAITWRDEVGAGCQSPRPGRGRTATHHPGFAPRRA